MGKLTQKDLLEEGFLDTVRAVGKASVAAAKALAPEIANPISNIVDPFKKTIEAFKLNNPSSFVNDKLKKEYYGTFYKGSPKKFRAYKIPGEPKSGGRVGISFEAIRINPVDIKAGGAATPPKPETYYAILTRGPDGWNMEVRDSQNREIKGQKEKDKKKSTRPEWDKEYKNSNLSSTPDYDDVKSWLLDYMPKYPGELQVRFGTDNIDDILTGFIHASTGKTNISSNTPLDSADINALEKGLKKYRIFENSQLDTIKQLKLFVESVNSQHECISIN